VSVFFASQIWP
jgi:hypothetical protein